MTPAPTEPTIAEMVAAVRLGCERAEHYLAIERSSHVILQDQISRWSDEARHFRAAAAMLERMQWSKGAAPPEITFVLACWHPNGEIVHLHRIGAEDISRKSGFEWADAQGGIWPLSWWMMPPPPPAPDGESGERAEG